MALPADGYIDSALRTTGEFKVGLADIVTDAARGNPEFTSTRTFEKGAKVKASNNIVFTSMININVGNTPQADDGSNWYASVFDNVLGLWADKTGLVSAGSGLYHNAVLWRVEVDIADVTLSEPSDNNASYSKSAGGAVFDFVVSQYAGGDKTKVAYITAGLALAAYDWFIDTNTLQVFSKNGATGTFSDPLDFNPSTGVDSGITGALKEISVAHIKTGRFAIFKDQKTTGTSGANTSDSTTYTRDLNTEEHNSISLLCSLEAGNVIRLQAGKFLIEAEAPVYNGLRSMTILTLADTTFVAAGAAAADNGSTNPSVVTSKISHVLDVTTQTDYVIRSVIATGAINGLGIAGNFSTYPETYTVVKISEVS